MPQGYPRFGYMLDHEGVPVGVLLLIYSLRDADGETAIHCNLSSWYVEPAFRNYAPMLTKPRAAPQGSQLLQHQPGALDLADHRGPGLSHLLQGPVLLVSRAVTQRAGHATVEIVSARCDVDRRPARCAKPNV